MGSHTTTFKALGTQMPPGSCLDTPQALQTERHGLHRNGVLVCQQTQVCNREVASALHDTAESLAQSGGWHEKAGGKGIGKLFCPWLTLIFKQNRHILPVAIRQEMRVLMRHRPVLPRGRMAPIDEDTAPEPIRVGKHAGYPEFRQRQHENAQPHVVLQYSQQVSERALS